MSVVTNILGTFIDVLMMLMFARAISSWFVRDLSNPIVRFLHEVTEPMVGPVRKFLQERNLGGQNFDFSFIIVYLALMLLKELIVTL